MREKRPPPYSLPALSDTTRARTELLLVGQMIGGGLICLLRAVLTPGFQALALLVTRSTAARRQRTGWPPAEVKSPPINMVSPEGARARTAPPTSGPVSGFQVQTLAGAPVVLSAAKCLRTLVPCWVLPSDVNSPPM